MGQRRIVRSYEVVDGRYWWIWTCDLCTGTSRYLNKEAMLNGSERHKDSHGRASS